MEVLTILFYAVVAVVLGCLGVLAYQLVKGTRGMEESSSQLEAQFEAEALRAVGAAAPEAKAGPSRAPAQPPAPLPSAPPSGTQDPAASPPPVPAATAAAAEDAVAELAKRLRLLGIATDAEGMVALPMPPNGQILRLRRGGLVAVLPRLEGEAFMAHLCRRFDMVVCPSAHGEPLVLQRLQARAAELMPALKE